MCEVWTVVVFVFVTLKYSQTSSRGPTSCACGRARHANHGPRWPFCKRHKHGAPASGGAAGAARRCAGVHDEVGLVQARVMIVNARAAPTLHEAVHTPCCWHAATRLLSGVAHDDPAAQHHRAAVWGLWSEHVPLCLGWRWRCWLCSGANVPLAFQTLLPPCACAILCSLLRMW